MSDIDENDMCINFGCICNCRKCDSMCDLKCKEYESRNTRKKELNKLYKSFNS